MAVNSESGALWLHPLCFVLLWNCISENKLTLGWFCPLLFLTDTCGEWHLQRFMPSLCPETLRYTEWEENVLLQGQNPSMTSKVRGHHFSLGEFITVKMTSSICLLRSLSWDEQRKISSPFGALFLGVLYCAELLNWTESNCLWETSGIYQSHESLTSFCLFS